MSILTPLKHQMNVRKYTGRNDKKSQNLHLIIAISFLLSFIIPAVYSFDSVGNENAYMYWGLDQTLDEYIHTGTSYDLSLSTPLFNTTHKINGNGSLDDDEPATNAGISISTGTDFSACMFGYLTTSGDGIYFFQLGGDNVLVLWNGGLWVRVRPNAGGYQGPTGLTQNNTIGWHQYCFTFQESSMALIVYIDTVPVSTTTLADGPVTLTDIQLTTDYNEIHNLDEVVLYNKTLSKSNIDWLYAHHVTQNKGWPYTEVILGNYSNPVLLGMSRENLTKLNESTDFYFAGNYTYNNGTKITNAECNFTATNVTMVTLLKNSSNYTLSLPSQRINLSFSENPLNLQDDILRLFACKETNANANLEIYFNTTLYRTITNSQLPLCSLGEYEFNNFTTQFNGLSNINVSIKCSTCGGGIRLISKNIEGQRRIFSYYRQFSEHTENLTYNASSGYYEYTAYPYKAVPPTVTTTLKCTRQQFDNSTRAYNVIDDAPFITFVSINDVKFTENMLVEFPENLTILTHTTGTLAYREINLTNSVGVLIGRSINTNVLESNSSSMLRSGYFNVSAYALDDDGNETYNVTRFRINDTVSPSITVTALGANYNLGGNTSVFVPLNAEFYDVNLFGYEVLVYRENTTLVWQYNKTNLTTTLEKFSYSLQLNETGNYSVIYNVSDDHTSKNFSDIKNNVDGRSIFFNFTKSIGKLELPDEQIEIYYLSGGELSKAETAKELDRYTFTYSFAGVALEGKKDIDYIFRVKCTGLYFRPYSKYTAHQVCWNTKTWVDLENKDIKKFRAKSCGMDCMEYALTMPETSQIRFTSIGGINFASSRSDFEVSNTTSGLTISGQNISDFACPETTQGVLLLIFLFAILICLILLSLKLEIGFIGIFGSFGIFLISFVILDCYWWVGVITGLAGLALVVWFSFQKWF